LLSVLEIDPSHAPTHRLLFEYYESQGKSERAAFHRKLADEADEAEAAIGESASSTQTGDQDDGR
jgi:hypothetical protein